MSENAEGLEDRCESRCPADTARSLMAKLGSPWLALWGYRERCILKAGHGGEHRGPSDVRWGGNP